MAVELHALSFRCWDAQLVIPQWFLKHFQPPRFAILLVSAPGFGSSQPLISTISCLLNTSSILHSLRCLQHLPLVALWNSATTLCYSSELWVPAPLVFSCSLEPLAVSLLLLLPVAAGLEVPGSCFLFGQLSQPIVSMVKTPSRQKTIWEKLRLVLMLQYWGSADEKSLSDWPQNSEKH